MAVKEEKLYYKKTLYIRELGCMRAGYRWYQHHTDQHVQNLLDNGVTETDDPKYSIDQYLTNKFPFGGDNGVHKITI